MWFWKKKKIENTNAKAAAVAKMFENQDNLFNQRYEYLDGRLTEILLQVGKIEDMQNKIEKLEKRLAEAEKSRPQIKNLAYQFLDIKKKHERIIEFFTKSKFTQEDKSRFLKKLKYS